jgi:hypothetical protein
VESDKFQVTDLKSHLLFRERVRAKGVTFFCWGPFQSKVISDRPQKTMEGFPGLDVELNFRSEKIKKKTSNRPHNSTQF